MEGKVSRGRPAYKSWTGAELHKIVILLQRWIFFRPFKGSIVKNHKFLQSNFLTPREVHKRQQ